MRRKNRHAFGKYKPTGPIIGPENAGAGTSDFEIPHRTFWRLGRRNRRSSSLETADNELTAKEGEMMNAEDRTQLDKQSPDREQKLGERAEKPSLFEKITMKQLRQRRRHRAAERAMNERLLRSGSIIEPTAGRQ
jgi:hypothetical protein